MKRKIKLGDVVAQTSDGPTMTVEKCDGSLIHCVWFGIDRRARWTGPHRRRFPRNKLVVVCQH